jgi:hypothetical protein
MSLVLNFSARHEGVRESALTDPKELIVVEPESTRSNVVAILSSGDINAIYADQILNPSQSELMADIALSQAVRR